MWSYCSVNRSNCQISRTTTARIKYREPVHRKWDTRAELTLFKRYSLPWERLQSNWRSSTRISVEGSDGIAMLKEVSASPTPEGICEGGSCSSVSSNKGAFAA